jgi:hypothetical protein
MRICSSFSYVLLLILLSFELDTYSPSFFLTECTSEQIYREKVFQWIYILDLKTFSNVMQKNTILSASTPFSPYFDASMVWGPTTGRDVSYGLENEAKIIMI